MQLTENKLNALTKLGEIFTAIGTQQNWPGFISGITEDEYNQFNELVNRVHIYNGWFTPNNVRQSLMAWGKSLTKENLNNWLQNYSKEAAFNNVGIVMAGNIPLVGFHDWLCTYVLDIPSQVKMSSDDDKLFPAVLNILSCYDADVKTKTALVPKLSDFDAVIATGSNNTARYFEEYFGKYPHIIRKNRTSVAVITGDETEEALKGLARDVFSYFGLGCRNVTKLFVPKGYDLNTVFAAFFDEQEVINNNKYANNYDYHKAVYLMERYEVIENGFLLVRKHDDIHSPIGTLNYDEYEDLNEVNLKLKHQEEQLQCIVGADYIPFGKAQQPELWDYADNVDVISFLTGETLMNKS